MTSPAYELLEGDVHRHGALCHAHPHLGPHQHPPHRDHDHEHTHEGHGEHAHVDAYVSLAVIASAIAIAAGAPILDPLIGLGMSVVILRITRESWLTVRGHPHL
jgi:hypothetical protein